MTMFQPNAKNATVPMAGNSSAQQVQTPGGGNVLRVVNRGPGDAYVFTTNDANAVAAVPAGTTIGGTPILANAPAEYLVMQIGDDRVAAICSANAALFFTRGQMR